MAERFEFLASEKEEIRELYTKLKDSIGSTLHPDDEENDAVHHEAREDVHLCDVQLTLFEDVGVEILVL